MPRYFFDVNDGNDDTDEHGTELADPDTAWRQAVRIATNVVLDLTHHDRQLSDDRGAVVVRARDGAGVIVATVHLAVMIVAD